MCLSLGRCVPSWKHCLQWASAFLLQTTEDILRKLVPCPQPPDLPLISRFRDPKINALIWALQLSGFSSRSLGSNQEGGSSKESGNQNKVKSMASQLLAKFEESSRNPSLLKQVSPIKWSLDLPSWWPELRNQKKCSGWWWISGIPARPSWGEPPSRSWVSRLF